MGNTPSGLWYPDKEIPIGSLHTILAQMQVSVENMRTALKTELTAALPFVAVYTTGTNQSFSATVETAVTGGAGGWQGAASNAQTSGAGIQVVTGVRPSPVIATTAGLYVISYTARHNVATGNGGSPGHAYTSLALSGSVTASRKNVWSLGYEISGTEVVLLPAGSTAIGLNTFVDGASGVITYAEFAVWKVR